MSFGSRLRERRESLGLKQNELGKLLGVTGSAVGNYENGVSSPRADILYKAFDVLNCDANYLFQDEMNDNCGSMLSKDEQRLVDMFHALNDEGKSKLLDYADDLVQSKKYIKNNTFELVEKAQ